jgi:hypothetical protein
LVLLLTDTLGLGKFVIPIFGLAYSRNTPKIIINCLLEKEIPMKISLLVLPVLLLLASCATTEKAEEATPAPQADRDYQIDYVLVDASQGERPGWILNPHVSDDSNKRAKYRYFVSEANRNQKRLCTKSAVARANARIAGEITQFIKNTYSESVQGTDDDVSEYMQEQLTQEIQSFVVGAETSRTYWEKRRYKKELGAMANKDTYACYALVKMKKENLSEMIKMARKKILRSIDAPEVKAKTEKAIKNVEDKFNNLEKPVVIDNV